MRLLLPSLLLTVAPLAWAAGPPAYRVETVASGLDHPWSIAFLPDGRQLVTERAGRLRIIQDGKLLSAPVSGVPPVWSHRQGGLMDVLPAPDFASSQRIYLSLAHRGDAGGATRVLSGRLDGGVLKDLRTVFTAEPAPDTGVHYGGRMAWLGDGTLLVTLGDGYEFREKAQDLSTHHGKLVRINADGSVPKDNPYVGRSGARPEIYSLGHRNPQGLVVDPATGRIYAHEHGPRGGDEVNLILPGRNYGWPVITYGVDYSGALISPFKEKAGLEQPLLHWTPSVAPAGMALIRGTMFPAWRGDLLVSTLVEMSVRRVDLQDGKVVGQEVLFAELGQRLRDVREAPDGSLYLLTDAADGKVLRVVAPQAGQGGGGAVSRPPS